MQCCYLVFCGHVWQADRGGTVVVDQLYDYVAFTKNQRSQNSNYLRSLSETGRRGHSLYKDAA